MRYKKSLNNFASLHVFHALIQQQHGMPYTLVKLEAPEEGAEVIPER